MSAQIFPKVAENFHESRAEEKIFSLLRNQLPDRCQVFHSWKWSIPNRDRNLTKNQGEADFIIYDPQFGILCMEVKGGRVQHEDGIWKQRGNEGEHSLKTSPWLQIEDCSYALRKKLNSNSTDSVVPVFSCLWFPDTVLQDKRNLPDGIHHFAFLTRSDFDSALQNSRQNPLDSVFQGYRESAFWKNYYSIPTGFSERVKSVVLPSLRLLSGQSSRNGQIMDEVYFRVTEEQSKVLDFIEDLDRVAIKGSAGSGKTLVAKSQAERFSQEEKTLFLVFNAPLRESLLQGLGGNPENLVIHNIHSLAMEVYGTPKESKGQENPAQTSTNEVSPQSTSRNYLDEILQKFIENILDDASQDPSKFPYKRIVIDEAQDFQEEWLEVLDLLVDTGKMFVFYDPLQTIQLNLDVQNKWLVSIDTQLSLNRNCRNTESIAKTAHSFIGKSAPKMLHTIPGNPPKFYIANGQKETYIKLIIKCIHEALDMGYAPGEITILSLQSLQYSEAKEIKSVQKNETNTKINITESKKDGNIWKSTVRKFKGLETPFLILIDLYQSLNQQTAETIEECKRLLYTGSSRAKVELRIISKGMPAEVRWTFGKELVVYPREEWIQKFRENYHLAE